LARYAHLVRALWLLQSWAWPHVHVDRACTSTVGAVQERWGTAAARAVDRAVRALPPAGGEEARSRAVQGAARASGAGANRPQSAARQPEPSGHREEGNHRARTRRDSRLS
jgi:hypothetical protein